MAIENLSTNCLGLLTVAIQESFNFFEIGRAGKELKLCQSANRDQHEQASDDDKYFNTFIVKHRAVLCCKQLGYDRTVFGVTHRHSKLKHPEQWSGQSCGVKWLPQNQISCLGGDWAAFYSK